MTKRETFSLLSMIQAYYDQFEVDQMKVDVWHCKSANQKVNVLKRRSFIIKFGLFMSGPKKTNSCRTHNGIERVQGMKDLFPFFKCFYGEFNYLKFKPFIKERQNKHCCDKNGYNRHVFLD
jgi:hypothetical protein